MTPLAPYGVGVSLIKTEMPAQESLSDRQRGRSRLNSVTMKQNFITLKISALPSSYPFEDANDAAPERVKRSANGEIHVSKSSSTLGKNPNSRS
jgi:hypothetical protein